MAIPLIRLHLPDVGLGDRSKAERLVLEGERLGFF